MIGIGSKNKAADFFKPPEWSKLPKHTQVRVEIFRAGNFIKEIPLAHKKAYTVGGKNEVVDIIVDDASVARLHCAFVHSSSSSFVFDLGSPSGTFLNGKRIAPHEPEMLSEGSEVRVSEKSQTTLVLKGLPLSKWQPPAWSKMPWSPAALFGRLPGADEFVSESRLSDQKCHVLGRNGAVVDILVQADSVSRQHAAVFHGESTLYVVDLGSAHGTWLSGERLEPNRPVQFREEAILQLGQAPIAFTLSMSGVAPRLKKRERAEADLSSSQFGSLVRTSVLQKTPSQTERSATGASESDVGDAFTAAKAEPAAAADAGRSGKTNADFRALLNSPVTLPKGMRKGAIEGKAALRKVQDAGSDDDELPGTIKKKQKF
ncbi:hypothetical protein CYMTET_17882 [Cymbomonas tetramitiformis]|uniref:FHA domain-containing protein n=1 Tax=Cymbomonas tetramitiformis TaxID=36881 RepID=A0AAE0G903_9CHLO|nr:hypothetical protein CYMTET_17882 [Cymbomonas tetramitiformis]